MNPSRWMSCAAVCLVAVLSPFLAPDQLPAQAPGAPYRTAWNPTMGSLPAALTVIAPQGEVRIRTGTGKYIAWRVELPWSKASQAVQDRAEAAIGARISPDSGAIFTISEGLPERAILVLLVPEQIGRLNVTIQRKGRIDVWDFKGEINVSNRRGSIILERTRGTVLADAPDGDIRLTVDSLPPLKSAGIVLLGNRGGISVALPSEASGQLLTRTLRGTTFSAFPEVIAEQEITLGGALAPQASARGSERRYLLGSGIGPLIQATVLDGNIIVTRPPPHPK